MQLASGISEARLAGKVGRDMRVMVDSIEAEAGVAVARSSADAPEIDGQVLIADARDLRPGVFADVRIVAADVYDLHALPADSGTR
jgi:ribosomal protein S12 methylthiotransferase